MAIGIIATLKVKEGQEAAFTATFKELAAAVRANEPGNFYYDLYKSKTEPRTFVVLERYKDADALAAHRKAPHMAAAGPKLGAVLDGAPVVTLLDEA